MNLLRCVFLLLTLAGGSLLLIAQNVPGYGWSSFGVLPFRGYDFVIVKAPTRYVAYYTRHSTTTLQELGSDAPGRAFSTDLKSWTVDSGDICATSGDLCMGARVGAMTLPDGRMRMFRNPGGRLISLISTDGVVWTLESGTRFTQDTTSIYERGNFALELASFVTLPDGSVRMYYEGGVVPGSPGTPAYYNQDPTFNGALLKATGMILSAISRDSGLTWVREPGVRINPLVQGPARNQRRDDGSFYTEINAADVTAVAVTENGRTVYRIYAPAWGTGTVSYVSTDGLSFVLEGAVPADQGDAKAVVLPDGRTWLVANQYPDGIDNTIVYGPQSLFLEGTRADVTLLPLGTQFPPPGIPPNLKSNSFHSILLGVTGTAGGPVTLAAVSSSATNCADLCSFHPEYYSFTPASGTPPFTTVMTYIGPANYIADSLIVRANTADSSAVAAITCMDEQLGQSVSTPFCQLKALDLPMNQMSFGFTPGAAASTQVSNILSPGGPGYPFTVSSSVPWASVTPATGVAPQRLSVKVDPAGLAPGTYTGTITISAEGTTEKIAITTVVSNGPVITSVRNAASSDSTVSPNSFVTVFGSGFTTSSAIWNPATSLPTDLAGVSAKVNGKDAFISYASPGQLNILTPPDTASGNVSVAVTNSAGTATANIILQQITPSWFSYSVGATTWAAALLGNTATYVAPAGSLSGITSRSAKVGDTLQLYANGLGATIPVPPPGIVLTSNYPLDDLSRVKVTIGGKPATVLFAGLVSSGLYQVNVQVPAGIATGELPVVMFVDGQPTQSGVTLNFQ
jgi:hypothetical protein